MTLAAAAIAAATTVSRRGREFMLMVTSMKGSFEQMNDSIHGRAAVMALPFDASVRVTA
ncbi:hypothetical protein GCM10010249_30720 [Streptomyces roseolilacinus]|uniref:Uncharacterized protein n=1 Tax=Streptomyces roseolilacinus TaxID=66904 RepID=A0A918B089_9ACTN|nr:hypothetical protein GCM10010249_30720 [Streptomyces roseolilacinus]